MPTDPKKRQKKLERKAAKRKQKQSDVKRQAIRPGLRSVLRQVGAWPLHEVLVSEKWNTEAGALVQVLVARRSEQGLLAAGVFLVDLGCLGVKNAMARLFEDELDYQDLRQGMAARDPLVPADLDLAAKIISEAIDYARRLGFEPHRDYYQAQPILGEANPAASSARIPLGGPEGKPLFVAGPYDNVSKIIARLTKAVGPDGFHYLVPMEPDAEFLVDDEP